MTDKDPKDMTVSEQLRWAANGEPYNGIDENIWTYPTGKIRALAEAVTGEWPSDNEIFSIVADKIDAELAQARRICLDHVASLWAKDNGWPDFKPGEDFGAWLERCAIPRPRYEDGEPLRFDYDTDELNGIEKFIFLRSGGGCCQMQDADGNICNVYPGERVKRPAPEVLLGDGNPVAKGDTVYVIESSIERTVKDFGTKPCEGMDGWDGSPWVIFDNGSWMHARDLTHERPVLGADGLPIEVGDTVWNAIGEEFSVTSVTTNTKGETVVWLGDCGPWNPAHLTHTPPDTQERIDADKKKLMYEYWECKSSKCGECPATIDGKKPSLYYGVRSCSTAQGMDIARRQVELDARKGGV